MQNIQNSFKGFVKSKDYRKATEVFLKLFTTGYLTNITGYLGFHDIDNSGNKLESIKYVDQYVTQPTVRSAIHVGNVVYNMTSQVVAQYMFEDISRSAEPNLTAIIDNGYKVLLFTGNFDIICGVESTNGLLMNQNWKYYNDYNKAKRDIWRVNKNDTQIAGYAKSFGNFTHVIVRNAGHVSLLDQPRATLDMAIRFLKSISFGQ
ncbi:probable serine carboxypeptidase CPVL [Oppia nitens]|uniref:probable serine carboxypeptidase CPVL n=1 Tax=Oppia nitens TaxID=1686743 RepID=UPI0023DC3636|nr:probable serine carboxypeptidase CPVL [Oppia nitens]